MAAAALWGRRAGLGGAEAAIEEAAGEEGAEASMPSLATHSTSISALSPSPSPPGAEKTPAAAGEGAAASAKETEALMLGCLPPRPPRGLPRPPRPLPPPALRPMGSTPPPWALCSSFMPGAPHKSGRAVTVEMGRSEGAWGQNVKKRASVAVGRLAG